MFMFANDDRPHRYRPLPDHAEFRDAFTVFERVLKKKGGIEEDAVLRLKRGRHSEVDAQVRMNLSRFTINSTRYVVSDSDLRLHRAFVQGYAQQADIARVMYAGGSFYSIGLSESLGRLVAHIQDEVLSDSETSGLIDAEDSPGHYRFALGKLARRAGIEIGEEAEATIVRWSEEIYPANEVLRKAYVIGHTVTAIAGMNRQLEINIAIGQKNALQYQAAGDPSTEE